MFGMKFLKKVSFEIGKRSNDVFKIPIVEQKEYISHFKEPKDDVERSYYQYCCQMKLSGILIHLFLNLASLPLLFFYYFKRCDVLDSEGHDAVFITEGILPLKLLPDLLIEEYQNIKEIRSLKECFDKSDKRFFQKLVLRYPFSWHFLFKNLLKIRIYSYLIHSYHPKAIIVCGEYSFTSSLLTDYCNYNCLLHIDVMHGEKFFFLRDAFFHYDKCYIWDNYYQVLFKELRAEGTQFHVYTPNTLCLGDGRNHRKTKDYTFYLGAQRGNQVELIISNLKKLISKGNMVAIRPHPLYTDLQELKKIINNECIEIENNKEIDIALSVLRTKNVISLYSTVLNQAYHSGVDIVIDDVTNPDHYVKLKSFKYMMVNVHHRLLSELIM